MIEPYLRRVGLTSGQACTLSLGLVLSGVLLVTSLPGVLDQRDRTRLLGQQQSAATGLTGDTGAPAPTPTPTVAPTASAPAPSSPTSTAPQPSLRVTESGYSTAGPAGARVPPGALPVEVRKGTPTATSYVRLTGSESRLVLLASPAGSSGPSSPSLQACRNRSANWRSARPGPAVPFEPAACAPGVLGADGRYTFDLSRFAGRDDPRGFAIAAVPGGSTQTYRVSLIPLRSSS